MANGQNGEIKTNGNGDVGTNALPIDLPKKKFLFVSDESLSGDLAWQIKKEGHEVKVYIKNEIYNSKGYEKADRLSQQPEGFPGNQNYL